MASLCEKLLSHLRFLDAQNWWTYHTRWRAVTFLFAVWLTTLMDARDVRPQTELYLPDYSVYHNYSSIKSHLNRFVQQHAKFVKADWSYHSKLKNPQIVLHLTDFTQAFIDADDYPIVPKLKVLLSYGEHAREFFPLETMFAFLDFVFKGLSNPENEDHSQFSKNLLLHFELYIIAVANPDGRLHVEKTGNYCWRGTSTGVDLNRNFDWQFGNKGSSGNIDDEEYRGQRAFSEPETTVFRELTVEQFDAFFSFHSGIRQIYLPFADTKSKELHKVPTNYYSMLELAEKMSKSTRHRFTFGEGYTLNEYTADGTIFDYMAGVRKIPFSMAVELWGVGDHKGARCFDLFNPKNEELQVATAEIIPLYQTLFRYLLMWKQNRLKKVLQFPDPISPESLRVGQVMLFGVVVITCYFAIHRYLPACLQCFPRRRIISIRNLSSTFKSVATFKST